MEDIATTALRRAREHNALVVLTVDPDGLWTMVPISMELVEGGFPTWPNEWAKLWQASVEDARAARATDDT